MWKVLAGLLLATAVVGGSLILYPMRYRLFRPDVGRVGGTRVVLDVKGDPDAVAAVLRRRLDPNEAEGIVVTADAGRVEIDVPNGRKHDENLQRVKRLAWRAGRFRAGVLAHDQDDAAAVAAGKKWLAAAANRKALEDAHAKGEPLPALDGEHKGKGPAAPAARYEWVSVDGARASVTHGMFGHAGAATARDHFPLAHELPAAGGHGSIFLTLLRLVPDGEGVSNADVAKLKVTGYDRGRYATRVTFRFDGDGRRRLLDLVTKQSSSAAPLPRRLAMVVDSDVLFYFDLGTMLVDTTMMPVVDTPADGEDLVALIRAPLPAGASVKVEKEQVLAGK